MAAAPRPSSFSGIGLYITGTRIALVAAAIAVPTANYALRADGPTAAVGIPVTIILGMLGALALLTEARPDRHFSQWWRTAPIMATWAVLLVAGSVLVLALPPSTSSAIAPTVLPLALALRAITGGSFWLGSLRVAGATIVCVIATGVLQGALGTNTVGLDLTIAAGAMLAFAVLGQDTVYTLALEVDDLRTTEAERAITHERQRFAGDLHDIQGQHLQLLAVEAQLVRRLIDTQRYEQAGQHADALGRIAASAVEEMRGVVHAYRAVTVADEAANAAHVLESAGIDVNSHIEVPQALAEATDRLLGLTIREGITNVLRHTHTQSCRLTVKHEHRDGRAGVSIVLADAGPSASQSAPAGTGISELKRRYREATGDLALRTTDTQGSQLEGWLPLTNERTPKP